MDFERVPTFPLISIQRRRLDNEPLEKSVYATIIRKEFNGEWYRTLVKLNLLTNIMGPHWEVDYAKSNDDAYQRFVCECYKFMILSEYQPPVNDIELHSLDINQISEYDRVLDLTTNHQI